MLVEEREPGVWLVRMATVIPDNERWLHTESTSASMQEALDWAQAHPADDSATEAHLNALRDA